MRRSVAEITKNKMNKVVIGMSNFHGVSYLDIREWFKPDDEWLPTKRGVAIPATFENVMKVHQAIEEILQGLPTEGPKDDAGGDET